MDYYFIIYYLLLFYGLLEKIKKPKQSDYFLLLNLSFQLIRILVCN